MVIQEAALNLPPFNAFFPPQLPSTFCATFTFSVSFIISMLGSAFTSYRRHTNIPQRPSLSLSPIYSKAKIEGEAHFDHPHKAMGVSKATKQPHGKGFKVKLPVMCRGVDVAIPLPSSGSSSPASSTSPSLRSKARVQELREVFQHFDVDSDGKISAGELRAFFTSVGEDMSPAEAEGVISDLDSDGDGLLGFGDFLVLMERDGMEEDLRKAFEMFEAVKGSGRITPRGLQRMLNRLGDERTYEECEAMIQAYDLDGNGELSFHEFHRMMS